jgi:hypothetical protein
MYCVAMVMTLVVTMYCVAMMTLVVTIYCVAM